MKQYVLYHLRWQASTIIMAPVMYGLRAFLSGDTLRLMVANACGAAIFYIIDRRIFRANLLLVAIMLVAIQASAADNSVKILNKGQTIHNFDRDVLTVKIVCIAGYKFQITQNVTYTGTGGSVGVGVSTSQIFRQGKPPQPIKCEE